MGKKSVCNFEMGVCMVQELVVEMSPIGKIARAQIYFHKHRERLPS